MKERQSLAPSPCTDQQRLWVRDLRDEGKCQFVTYDGSWEACLKGKRPKGRTGLEVHHIYPNGLQKVEPKPWGGTQPQNLITLCEEHHDLQCMHMAYAKAAYKYDQNSYTRWINFAHKMQEQGLSPYNQDHEYMLRTIASFRTKFYLKVMGGEPFPKRETDE